MPRKPKAAAVDLKPVQAKLPPIYRERLQVLAARTGREQRDHIQDALDWLFQQHRDKLDLPESGDRRGSTLKGA